jgi:hypothetical protein
VELATTPGQIKQGRMSSQAQSYSGGKKFVAIVVTPIK